MRIRWLPEAAVKSIYKAALLRERLRFAEDPAWKAMREMVLPHLPYIVFYRIKADAIEILYIRHGAQGT